VGTRRKLSKTKAERKAEGLINSRSIQEMYESSKTTLKDLYGVNNLSLIEAVHLKNIVMECKDYAIGGLAAYLMGKASLGSLIGVPMEATER